MNTFWLKLALVFVLVVAAIVIVSKFAHSRQVQKEQPAPQEKTVGDVWREDDRRLRAEPNVAPAASTGQAASSQQEEQKPAVKFKELTEEERVGAEQLFEMALAERKMGRLPAMSYGRMVNYCRDIIQKYPGSEFEYKARRMLGEVPRDQWDRYKITEQEINPAK
jgi:type IV secretory pathway VirB10-like protein